MLRIEMLPAAHGDALLVEWGSGDHTWRMLVDGGPLGTYPALHERIAALPSQDFEILIVTHIDGDHIEGVIRALQDRRALRMRFGDVWFNGWPQLQPRDQLGASYGEMVGALLEKDQLPWNVRWNGKPVAVPATGALPSKALAGGATITLLTPGPEQLRALRREWTAVLADVGVRPGDADAALKQLGKRTALRGLDVLGGKDQLDNSVANGSSIAVLFEHRDGALLLTGDTHSQPLAAGIRRLLAERGQSRLQVDVFKLPHHCSRANVTDDLLSVVTASHYLVSTNGARYRHPDEQAVLRVLRQADRPASTKLVFNYLSETTKKWADPAVVEEFGYQPVFPSAGVSGIVVEL